MQNTSENLLYCVVEFPEERDGNNTPMAIVSTVWLRQQNDNSVVCMWPKYLKNETERIRVVKSHTPLMEEKCEPCQILIKYKTAIFSKAEKRMKDLESLSTVYDDEEDEQNEEDEGTQPNLDIKGRRVRKPNPKFQQFDTCRYISSSDEDQVPNVPPFLSKKTTNSQINEVTKTSEKSKPDLDKTRGCIRKLNPKFQDSDTGHISSSHESEIAGLSFLLPRKEPEVQNSKIIKTGCSSANNTVQCKCEAVMEEVLRKLNNISNDIKTVLKNLPSQRTTMDDIEDNGHIKNLPAETKEALEEFNEILSDHKIMADVCNYFQVIGGKDVVDATRRILTKLLTNELCLTYNWSGKNNKNKFSDLKNILKFIVATVRRNLCCRTATQNEVDDVIKAWLRNAGDREGGRSRRRNKNPDGQVNVQ